MATILWSHERINSTIESRISLAGTSAMCRRDGVAFRLLIDETFEYIKMGYF